MNKAKEVFDLAKPVFDSYNIYDAQEALSQMGAHGLRDVYDKKDWGYYQFLPCLMKVFKPKQVVELGGSVGTACLMMLTELPKTSMLYSINLVVNGEEFSYIKKDYPNLTMIRGNDLDLLNWAYAGVDLSKTDILFIDTEHNREQLTKELNLYFPFLKIGTIILFDDIHLNKEMDEVWNEIKCDKYDAPLHFSGFGIVYKNLENWH